MDIEKPRRFELMKALQGDFVCYEEVTLRHALFKTRCIQADVVAIPMDERFWGYALAFEVKQPNVAWNSSKWAQVLRQASDYVYARIEPRKSQPELEQFRGRRISGAFIFPSPAINARRCIEGEPLLRQGDEKLFVGALQLALHFRVGHGGWEQTGIGPRFKLNFGPNEIWRSDCGFCCTSLGLVTGKRTVGSQKIDVRSELDGIGSSGPPVADDF